MNRIISVLFVFNGICCNSTGNIQTEALLVGNKIKEYLTDDSIKYWDSDVGYSWRFNKSGFKIDYAYNYFGVRVLATYGGDIIIDSSKWKLGNDSLFITIGKDKILAYKILELTPDTLIVIDPINAWNTPIIHFRKSDDQLTSPIKGSILPDDTSLWPIKTKEKK